MREINYQRIIKRQLVRISADSHRHNCDFALSFSGPGGGDVDGRKCAKVMIKIVSMYRCESGKFELIVF